ncbi:MAG TPA: alpha/beta hydrolase-fold protein [Polyangia bacterium]|nr:alpha/beta hydrolase-fold protein [Polyangia bacterium]
MEPPAKSVAVSAFLLGIGALACVNNQIPERPVVDGSPATGVPEAGAAPEVGSGCNLPLPAGTTPTVPGSPKGYTQFQVMGTGANLTDTPMPAKAGPRTFWVRVPADYDPGKPYRVVYLGAGCGSLYTANTSTYPLFQERLGGTEEAIYVAIDIPPDGVNGDCFDNQAGPTSQEWEAFELFHTFVDAHYCVDNDRIYVAGYSTGGWLANMWGCYFAGTPSPPRKFAPHFHLRGEAAVTSGEPANDPPCNGPVAAIWIHDNADAGNPIMGAYDACARALKMNGCVNASRCEAVDAQTIPWHHEIPMLDVCEQYSGCPKEYPVVFCKTQGFGHTDQAERVITAFTHFFDDVEAP